MTGFEHGEKSADDCAEHRLMFLHHAHGLVPKVERFQAPTVAQAFDTEADASRRGDERATRTQCGSIMLGCPVPLTQHVRRASRSEVQRVVVSVALRRDLLERGETLGGVPLCRLPIPRLECGKRQPDECCHTRAGNRTSGESGKCAFSLESSEIDPAAAAMTLDQSSSKGAFVFGGDSTERILDELQRIVVLALSDQDPRLHGCGESELVGGRILRQQVDRACQVAATSCVRTSRAPRSTAMTASARLAGRRASTSSPSSLPIIDFLDNPTSTG